jgi:hypothetical protein
MVPVPVIVLKLAMSYREYHDGAPSHSRPRNLFSTPHAVKLRDHSTALEFGDVSLLLHQ